MSGQVIGFDVDRCRQAASIVGAWRRPLLLAHTRADGDAIGALLAVSEALDSLGADPLPMLFEPPQPRYEWLLEKRPIEVFDESNRSILKKVDGLILLDTCAYSQLEPVASWIEQTGVPKLAVDHHVTRDVAVDFALIDEHASATCLLVYEWLKNVSWQVSPAGRMALYVGLATDTGWFRFANTDARSLEAAAELVRGGVEPAQVFERIYQNEAVARFRLLGEALNSVELHVEDRLAVMPIRQSTFERAHAGPDDTEDLVNYPLQVASVDVSILLVEQADGGVRASFRSKPPNGHRADIDVSALAAEFKGGGHRRAAAMRLTGDFDEVKRRVIERASAELGQTAGAGGG